MEEKVGRCGLSESHKLVIASNLRDAFSSGFLKHMGQPWDGNTQGTQVDSLRRLANRALHVWH
jgi:hypothetical protein